jgi:DNA processing protein
VDSSKVGITNGLREKYPQLYVAGDLSLLDMPGVAIVGSRNATAAGRARAAVVARALVASRVAVVSGLALGIDEAAHIAAIEAKGKTIAVIGTPLEKAYPANHAWLQERIYEEHLLISPFAAGERTFPSSFPERNRVMARITRATVIVEAADDSGSLHQAVECEKVGRPLFISRAIVGAAKVTWPQRFKRAHIFDDPKEILAEIAGGG